VAPADQAAMLARERVHAGLIVTDQSLSYGIMAQSVAAAVVTAERASSADRHRGGRRRLRKWAEARAARR
jgi:hypothetical protein